MPTTRWAPPAATERANPAMAGLPQPGRAFLRAVQIAVAAALAMALIRVGSIFAALPDIGPADRWGIALEIFSSRFVAIGAQLAFLHGAALAHDGPRLPRAGRFLGMVLVGTLGASATLMLPVDMPSIRLGIVESPTTGTWNALFDALLTATFLVYQHGGRARGEEAARRVQQLQREQRAARRRLVEAQLQAMQARVDPPLFFEVLDSVQRLYATDAARAEALLDELIVFLRAALPRLRSASSTLAQELDLAASFFRLQNLRDGASPAVRIDLPSALATRAFPPGMILPLLSELHASAVKVVARGHAGTDGVTVSLHAERAPSPGVIAQLRETLSALYGSAAALECEAGPPGSNSETRITISDAAA